MSYQENFGSKLQQTPIYGIKMLISSVLIFDLLLHESTRQEKVRQVDINEVDYKV